jgi:methionyl-tRNA formyltransferase
MEEKTAGSQRINPQLPRLIFMGTPDFAVPALRRLFEAGADIAAVVTQPDRPSGRGRKLSQSPVKILAGELALPVYQPERVRPDEVIQEIRTFGAECAVVVAFGQILPQKFLDLFPLGALNVHASLLPRYRGAAPIQRALLAGEEETGVTVMLLDAGMDTGPVLAAKPVRIGERETFGALYEKLAVLGADLLCRTLAEWRAGRIAPRPQEDALATSAPPLRKEEQRVRWELAAEKVADTIRAFDPWPGAYFFIGGKRVKCFDASLFPYSGPGKPGEVAGLADAGLAVLAGDGRALAIGQMQMEGQKKLGAAEFMRGRPIPIGSVLE